MCCQKVQAHCSRWIWRYWEIIIISCARCACCRAAGERGGEQAGGRVRAGKLLYYVRAVPAAAQLVSEVLSKLEGAYGLLVKSAYYPGELVACKLGSPLLLGVKEAGGGGGPKPRTPLNSPARKKAAGAGGAFEAFIASDASAFVEHTKQCAAALATRLCVCALTLPISCAAYLALG